jgi:hypothetical protein
LSRPAYIERIADPAGASPEDLLIAREQLSELGIDEEPEAAEPLERVLQRDRLSRVLDQLSPSERDALVLCFGGGQSGRAVAERSGVTKQMVQERIRRAMKRVRWLLGPGALFTGSDVEALTCVSREEAKALAVLWRTTSYSAVQRERLISSQTVAWRLIREAVPRLPQPFRRGFEALMKDGMLLLWSNESPPSAVEVFVDRRLVFGPAERVAARPLFGAYESFARHHARPISLARFRSLLEARGVKPARVRVWWKRDPVPGFRGVGLQQSPSTAATKTGLPRPERAGQ